MKRGMRGERILRLIVLDTSVVSYIFNGDSRANYYVERIRGLSPFISFQTLEEAWHGAYAGGWGNRRKDELAAHMNRYRVIWPNPPMVQISADLRSEREKAGRRLNTADAWIAATAILLECPLASHDRDFSDIPGLEFIRAP